MKSFIIDILDVILLGHYVKKGDIGEACCMHGQMRNVYKILI